MGGNGVSENNNNIDKLMEQQREERKLFLEQLKQQQAAFLEQQKLEHAAFLDELKLLKSTPALPQPSAKNNSNEPRKIDRWTMPFLVGACSGLVWIMQNGFVPFYNSFGSIWLGMFYGPALIGYLIYVLGTAMEQKRYHSEHPEAGGLHSPQLEKINSECMWLGLKIALSLLGAQVVSRIMFANGLAQVIEKSMGGWSGRLLDTMPIEFHIGMMIASSIGFALCFAALSYYQKGKLSMQDLGVALGVGLFAGGGVYIAHLLPGMNTMFNWNIPEGISLTIGAVANGAVLTTALAIKPSLVDVSGVSSAPEATKQTVLLSQSREEKVVPKQESAFTRLYKTGTEQVNKLRENLSKIEIKHAVF